MYDLASDLGIVQHGQLQEAAHGEPPAALPGTSHLLSAVPVQPGSHLLLTTPAPPLACVQRRWLARPHWAVAAAAAAAIGLDADAAGAVATRAVLPGGGRQGRAAAALAAAAAALPARFSGAGCRWAAAAGSACRPCRSRVCAAAPRQRCCGAAVLHALRDMMCKQPLQRLARSPRWCRAARLPPAADGAVADCLAAAEAAALSLRMAGMQLEQWGLQEAASPAETATHGPADGTPPSPSKAAAAALDQLQAEPQAEAGGGGDGDPAAAAAAAASKRKRSSGGRRGAGSGAGGSGGAAEGSAAAAAAAAADGAGGRQGPGKGLRHFSLKVCEKVESKGDTTYEEVANELIADLAAEVAAGEHAGRPVPSPSPLLLFGGKQPGPLQAAAGRVCGPCRAAPRLSCAGRLAGASLRAPRARSDAALPRPRPAPPALTAGTVEQLHDEKNIRRRVYDALNVLEAIGMINKNKKAIQWKGWPSVRPLRLPPPHARRAQPVWQSVRPSRLMCWCWPACRCANKLGRRGGRTAHGVAYCPPHPP